MGVITFDDYRDAIQRKYEQARSGKHSSFLENPSPAQLRDLCLILAEEKLSNDDLNAIRNYFKAKTDEPLRNAIDRFGLGKLRSVQEFLLGANSSNLTRVELAAVLVDFAPRPYRKFQKSESHHPEETVVDDNKVFNPQKGPEENRSENRSKRMRKGGIVLLVAAVLGIGGMQFLNADAKECMQWDKNHYQVVDCSEVQGIAGHGAQVVKKDEVLLEKMKKLEVCDTTTFFIDGKPVVWYAKIHGKCQFFSHYGLHPETGKTLKPVTRYIINKYVLKKNNE